MGIVLLCMCEYDECAVCGFMLCGLLEWRRERWACGVDQKMWVDRQPPSPSLSSVTYDGLLICAEGFIVAYYQTNG